MRIPLNEPAHEIVVLNALLGNEGLDKPAQIHSLTRAFTARTHKVWMSMKVRKAAKIRNRYNQVPHLTQDTESDTSQTRAKRSALSQQVTTRQQRKDAKS